MTDKTERTCCFTGHRDIARDEIPKIRFALNDVVSELISKKGVAYFGAGGARGFDTIAALAVVELKERYPHIKLILVLPCKDQTKGWNKGDIALYEDIKARADKVVYTSQTYFNGCMHKRDRHLVNHSRYCVCYKTRETGGTAYTVRYAAQNNLTIINLAQRLRRGACARNTRTEKSATKQKPGENTASGYRQMISFRLI